MKYFHNIPKGVCNRNQAQQALQRYPTCLTDSGHDYIFDEVVRRKTVEYEGNIHVEDDEDNFSMLLSR